MKINNSTLVQLKTLKSYPHNVKEHPKEQIEDLKTLMKDEKIGYTNPIIIDENNMILAGHGRVQAMAEMGELEIPCIKLEGLTESEKSMIVIYDNSTGESPWNPKNFKIVFDNIGPILIEKFEMKIDDTFKSNPMLAEDQWINMPEFIQRDKSAYHQLIINFKNKDNFNEFVKLVNPKITESTKSVWFPHEPRRNTKTLSWQDQDES